MVWVARVYVCVFFVFFFFQAEDGIRDTSVTGVQTCALPISPREVRYFFTKNFWSLILSEIVSQTHFGVVIDVVKFQIPQVFCC